MFPEEDILAKTCREECKVTLTTWRQAARQEATLMLADRVAVAAVRVLPPATITAVATNTAMDDGGNSLFNIFSQSNTVINTTTLFCRLWFAIRRCALRGTDTP